MFEVKLPITIRIGRKKTRFRIGLNNALKLSWRLLYSRSEAYKKLVKTFINKQYKVLPVIDKPVKLTVILYPKTRAKQDLDNLAPAVKYITDTVVDLGILPADDYKVITEVLFKFGGLSDTDDSYIVYSLK